MGKTCIFSCFTHVFFFLKTNFYGFSIGVDVEKPGTQVVHVGPGEIACVAGSRGIPEMDPNGSAWETQGNGWMSLDFTYPKKAPKEPKNEYILLYIYIYMYIYSYNIYIDII